LLLGWLVFFAYAKVFVKGTGTSKNIPTCRLVNPLKIHWV